MQTVIFIHIPKAAGSTLSTIIDRQHHADNVYTAYVSVKPGTIRTSTPLQSADARLERLRALSDEKRAKIRVFRGHEGFGVHEFLPQPYTYITLLRDPVDRIISHYYYVLRTPTHYLYEEVTSRQMDLKAYAASGLSTELDNSQTKYLAGLEAPYLNYGDYSADILKTARQNIREHFAVVGLIDRFDETLLLLKKALGWKLPFYTRVNVTDNRPRKRDLPTDTIRTIEAYNELDIELYRFAQSLFAEKMRRYGPAFDRDLRVFTSLNR
ncbi:MAG: sulfotransferase family 2 domain-containing protein, partial [Gammaproteobacteria bacterium]|nr:sulfotransferase family 2 domain-containing protein [Gammaproteobacteria bacterium]